MEMLVKLLRAALSDKPKNNFCHLEQDARELTQRLKDQDVLSKKNVVVPQLSMLKKAIQLKSATTKNKRNIHTIQPREHQELIFHLFASKLPRSLLPPSLLLDLQLICFSELRIIF